MTGALIPDDWDGSTFECLRIHWPASEKWRAVLLGQTTEATRPSFWDSETGSVEDTIEAVQDAANLTAPLFYTEGCDEMPILVPSFKAVKTGTQAIAAGTWTKIVWGALSYDFNDPEYVLVDNEHLPESEANMGLWHHDVGIQFELEDHILLRVLSQQLFAVVNRVHVVNNIQLNLGFNVNAVDGLDNAIHLEAWSLAANTIIVGSAESWWSGFKVGPTVEA